MAMCSELGPEGGTMMQEYVESAGGTSLCSLEEPYKGCSDKEKKFIVKMKSLSPSEWQAQLDRLDGMKQKKMKDTLLQWVNARRAILKKFLSSPSEESQKTEL